MTFMFEINPIKEAEVMNTGEVSHVFIQSS